MTGTWRTLAEQQAGLLSRRQLSALGIDRFRVRNQVAAQRWAERSAMVVSTTTGPLTREQLRWLGVLHAGGNALVGDLSAAEVAGLANWHRDDVTVLVADDTSVDEDLPCVRFVRTRRPLAVLRRPGPGLPVCRLEPAVLHFAAYQPSARTAQGVLAAVVQQGLTTPEELAHWVRRMRPLRRAPLFRQVLEDIAGGSQSLAELDVLRLCRTFSLSPPTRQVQRRDADGRRRFTDCEWELPDGRTLVLEVDGSFHMDVAHWEDDLARQRALTREGRLLVRCTARELREDMERVARDLAALGVPRAVAS